MDASTISHESKFNFIIAGSPKSPRQAKKHHAGSLPLYMFLSLDERNALEKCPNSSNPYHKCTEACIKKLKQGAKPADSSAIMGSSLDKRKVHPKCPNVSNPYHRCTDRCLQKINSAGKNLNISGHDSTQSRDMKNVHPKCPNASNPFHTTCTEACMRKISTLANKQTEEKTSVADATIVRSQCKYASNPYHNCTETCTKKVNSVVVGAIDKGKNMKKETKDANPKNSDASDTKNLNSSKELFDKTNEDKKLIEESDSSLLRPAEEEEEKGTAEDKGDSEGNSDENEKVFKILEKSYSSCSLSFDSTYKHAVDDSLIEEYQSRDLRSTFILISENTSSAVKNTDDCINAPNMHNNDVTDNLHQRDRGEEEKTNCLYPSDRLLSSQKDCFGKLSANDQARGWNLSGLEAEENCFFRIDVQIYLLLYLAIIMTVIIARGSK